MLDGSSGEGVIFTSDWITPYRHSRERTREKIDEWGGHLARLRRQRRRRCSASGFAGTRARRPRHSIFQFLHTIESGNDEIEERFNIIKYK
jgi:hypothetical protein